MGTMKNHYYAISDPLLEFWYCLIFENQELISKNRDIVFEASKNKIEDFIARSFERICLLYMEELNNNGKLPEIYSYIRNFKADKTKIGRSVEIDGIAKGKETLLFMECKFRNTKFNNAMLNHLIESASIFSDEYKKYYYVFSKSGFDKDIKQNKFLKCIDIMNDIFLKC